MGFRALKALAVSTAVVATAASTSYVIARSRRAVTYAEARAVVDRRCVACHSQEPTSRAFPIAPKGIMLDTPEQMRRYALRIQARAVVERTMPLANMSGMTDEERWLRGRWIETGATVP